MNLQRSQLPLPSRESVTYEQLNNLIGVLHNLQPYLLLPQRVEEDSWKSQHKNLDGIVVTEAALAAQAALERITAIIKEPGRWDMKTQQSLEESLQRIYTAQEIALKAQTQATVAATTPCILFKPNFVKLPDGTCVAYYGDGPHPQIVGTGKTFEEALQSYNAQFRLPANEQTQIEDDTKAPPPPPSKQTKRGKKK